MSRARLIQLDFSGGENTKDHPRSLAKDECQELVNLYPGQEPRPREGCSRWHPADIGERVGALIDWADANGNKVIVFTPSGFSWLERSRPGVTSISSMPSGLRHDAKLSWVRVEGALIIGSDVGWSGIIEWDSLNHTFTLRSANIQLPPTMWLQAESYTSYSGLLESEKWYSYAFTLVNLGKNEGIPVTEGFIPGKLESWENLDKRVTVKTAPGDRAVQLTFRGVAGVDPQATHIRIYRTLPQAEESIAKGYTHGWVCDIPLLGTGVVIWIDTIANTEADQAPVTSSYNEMPAVKSMIYANGHLWINGAFGGSPGRWWFSSGIQDAVGYLKSLTMFDLSKDFKDCSLNDAEVSTGAMLIQGDLYFFNQRSIFRLYDANPSNNPKVVSTKVGCPFPRTLTAGDTWGLFLSEYGPRMIQGGAVDPVKWNSGEVWPNAQKASTILKADPDSVVGFWYRSTWWIASGRTVVGLHEDELSGKRGGMTVEFADPGIRVDHVAVFSESEAVIASKESFPLVWFLRAGATMDLESLITVRIGARRFFVDITDPSKKGEPWDIRIGATFTDIGAMGVRLVGDAERFKKRFRYQTRPKTALLQPQDVSPAVVRSYQQAVPAHLHASSFDITVEKIMRYPFDFRITSIELGYIPRTSRPQDDVSVDIGTDEPLDSDLALVDSTEVVA